MTLADDERRYVRTVEAAWSRLLGRQVVVSPREFETITAWRRRGIPVSVVLEVIADAGKRRGGRAPRALTGLAHAVSEAWATVAAGRASPNVADARPARSDALRSWEQTLAQRLETDPLRALLESLLAKAALGIAAEELDAALDASLPTAVPDELLTRATQETIRALGAFRERMSAEEFRNTFDRALADHLRGTLSLPRLALTR